MASIQPLGGTLTRRQAAHLLRRATFGPNKQQIDAFEGLPVAEAVSQLLTEQPLPPHPVSPTTGQPLLDPDNGRFSMGEGMGEDFNTENYVMAWWLAQMHRATPSVHEKMVFYFHTHFTNMRSRMRDHTAVYYQLAFFRYYALGNFKTLTHKMCIDNAMLRFLDGRLNVKGKPQENFARELFELYTVGKGIQRGDGDYTTFTETDVREATRVLTGWEDDQDFESLDADTGLAIGKMRTNSADTLANRHDAGEKRFSEVFNNQVIAPAEVVDGYATIAAANAELTALIEMIFVQEATAKHLCRKLYRFFVYYKIDEEIERDIIIPMAETLMMNDFEVKPALELLFNSQHFFDLDDEDQSNDRRGAIIKSPLELLLGTLRFFNMQGPDPETEANLLVGDFYRNVYNNMELQGLPFLEPFEVAGYSAYHQNPAFQRNWISSNYLAYRYKFIDDWLMENEDMDMGEMEEGPKLDVVAYVDDPNNISDPSEARVLAEELIADLLPEPLPEERFNYFFNAVLLDTLSEINWRFEWQHYKDSGDDTAVRIQLNNFVRALIQSPEYQLS